MKKAQITVFIIIGILLIAGMLVTFFFYSIKSKSSLGIIEDQTTKLAAEFLPIKHM